MSLEQKLIALDLGEVRIGLAVSGSQGMALPAGHIVRSKLVQDVRQVISFAKDHRAEGIVVGIPYMVDGGIGNKKVYDPRSYLKKAEEGMAARICRACDDLCSAGKSIA